MVVDEDVSSDATGASDDDSLSVLVTVGRRKREPTVPRVKLLRGAAVVVVSSVTTTATGSLVLLRILFVKSEFEPPVAPLKRFVPRRVDSVVGLTSTTGADVVVVAVLAVVNLDVVALVLLAAVVVVGASVVKTASSLAWIT